MQICGIDDAGRGSMLGPLVIAGVSLEKKNLRKLTSLGVKDSKKLSSKSRGILYKKISNEKFVSCCKKDFIKESSL